jgi:hypothetical protein
LTEDLALEQARAAEREILAGRHRGPLHGIPYALKDLVAVKGYRTTWGARAYADQRFEYNATIVEKLNRAGAVLIGKAAMIELAGGLGYTNGDASLSGPCKNPWKTDCWTCGSSSGSAAVVAAGLAPWGTINRLDIPRSLHRCLATSNIVDNPHSGVRDRTRRVCRWRPGMPARWSAAAFLEIEQSFRKIMGYRDLWALKAILDGSQPATQQAVA